MPVNPKDRRDRRTTTGELDLTSLKRERRMGDRRDSPRIPITVWVRHLEQGGSFEQRDGDIGLGGVYFIERHLPATGQVEVRFRLPTIDQEIRCQGEVLRISGTEGSYGVHVRFTDLPTAIELAIARFIDERVKRP